MGPRVTASILVTEVTSVTGVPVAHDVQTGSESPSVMWADAGTGPGAPCAVGTAALAAVDVAAEAGVVAEALWGHLQGAMGPVLRKAYQHVHHCNCDFVVV